MTRLANLDFAACVTASFDKQNAMQLIRATLPVVEPGRTLIVTRAEVFAVKDGKETLCALMQQTIMVMHGKTEK